MLCSLSDILVLSVYYEVDLFQLVPILFCIGWHDNTDIKILT